VFGAWQVLAQTISDVAFWCQWLIRGYLFEGKQHWEVPCAERFLTPVTSTPGLGSPFPRLFRD
jgi:hypothetical protein